MTATSLKIAIREIRASSSKFIFVVVAVAIGVASLTGVRGFSETFRAMLLREARALMAADISVRIFGEPSAEQQSGLNELKAQYTRVTETVSMVTSPTVGDPVLVSLKAVDPNVFPYYGALTLSPQTKLTAETVALSEDARIRLKTQVGERLIIGGQSFTIASIVTAEPDRMSGSFNVGPRVMISREGLSRTGLLQLGSRASQRFLFKIQANDVSRVRDRLRKIFPEALISDFREINPNISRGIDRATAFLSLVSLIALIVGAIGVATAMHAHLQSKLDGIAIMKSIGARSSQVVRIYLIQTLLLGLAGALIGIVAGSAVQWLFPVFLERYFQMKPDLYFTPVAALQGLLIGLLTTLLFTLPPLLGIREVKPALILRRDMTVARRRWPSVPVLFSVVVICAGIAAIAFWLSNNPRQATAFSIALVVGIVVLSGIATLLMKLLQRIVRLPMPVMLRHAMANLYRPGSQARSALTALGIGVMFSLTVFLVQRQVLQAIERGAPPGMSNVFFLDIKPDQRNAVEAIIRKHPGVAREPEILPAVSCRIVSIDGKPVEQLKLSPRYRMSRNVTTIASKPEGTVIEAGKWWTGPTPEPQISVTEIAISNLKIRRGSTIVWNAFGRTIATKVVAVHLSDSQRLASTMEFIMSPGALEGLPTVYYAAARVQPQSIASLQRASYERFPNVTVINLAEVLDRVEEMVSQIALVIRFISAFTVLTGAIILASSIAGSRYRRVREVVIFKTLGATRARIAAMFSAEFLILGTVAGIIGSLLATAFTFAISERLFRVDFNFELLPILIAIVLSALVSSAAGWLASYRMLGQKPLEVLRSE